MFKQFIEKVAGADVWMISSMLVFISFFVGVTFHIIFSDKKHLDEMAKMPLNQDNPNQ